MSSTKKRPAIVAFAGLILIGLPVALSAAVRLPAVIGDHMVVQQDKPVAVWGWANKAEPVTVDPADGPRSGGHVEDRDG